MPAFGTKVRTSVRALIVPPAVLSDMPVAAAGARPPSSRRTAADETLPPTAAVSPGGPAQPVFSAPRRPAGFFSFDDLRQGLA